MSGLTPYIPIHPGEMLKDELNARGITQKRFAEAVGVPYTQLNEILNGKHAISADFALLLEAALGTKAYLWVRLQADYNLQVARMNEKNIHRLNTIRNIAALF